MLLVQDDGEKHESETAAADEAGFPRKRLRDYPAPQLQSIDQSSNGSAAARGQQSQAPGPSAYTSGHSDGINRPGGHKCSAFTKAAERPQNSSQAAVEELRRLKEKIARQEAKMQREQVGPALPCYTQ